MKSINTVLLTGLLNFKDTLQNEVQSVMGTPNYTLRDAKFSVDCLNKVRGLIPANAPMLASMLLRTNIPLKAAITQRTKARFIEGIDLTINSELNSFISHVEFLISKEKEIEALELVENNTPLYFKVKNNTKFLESIHESLRVLDELDQTISNPNSCNSKKASEKLHSILKHFEEQCSNVVRTFIPEYNDSGAYQEKLKKDREKLLSEKQSLIAHSATIDTNIESVNKQLATINSNLSKVPTYAS